jgi:hypothetical protein
MFCVCVSVCELVTLLAALINVYGEVTDVIDVGVHDYITGRKGWSVPYIVLDCTRKPSIAIT